MSVSLLARKSSSLKPLVIVLLEDQGATLITIGCEPPLYSFSFICSTKISEALQAYKGVNVALVINTSYQQFVRFPLPYLKGWQRQAWLKTKVDTTFPDFLCAKAQIHNQHAVAIGFPKDCGVEEWSQALAEQPYCNFIGCYSLPLILRQLFQDLHSQSLHPSFQDATTAHIVAVRTPGGIRHVGLDLHQDFLFTRMITLSGIDLPNVINRFNEELEASASHINRLLHHNTTINTVAIEDTLQIAEKLIFPGPGKVLSLKDLKDQLHFVPDSFSGTTLGNLLAYYITQQNSTLIKLPFSSWEKYRKTRLHRKIKPYKKAILTAVTLLIIGVGAYQVYQQHKVLSSLQHQLDTLPSSENPWQGQEALLALAQLEQLVQSKPHYASYLSALDTLLKPFSPAKEVTWEHTAQGTVKLEVLFETLSSEKVENLTQDLKKHWPQATVRITSLDGTNSVIEGKITPTSSTQSPILKHPRHRLEVTFPKVLP